MARFVDLVAIEGPEQGMRWSVEEGAFRVIARAEDQRNSTIQMTPDGDRALDKDQAQLVDNYFQTRGTQSRRGFKKRGPDIILRDGSVSRTHALVFVDKDGASIVDLMSTNGTKVNDQPVRDVDVKPGDVVWVGKSKLAIEEG